MYKTADMNLWQGRSDPGDGKDFFRLHQWVQSFDNHKKEKGAAIIGFSCDEGVQRNHGRPGSSLGPAAIRGALAGMACHTDSPLYDAGDVICYDHCLEEAQNILEDKISNLLNSRLRAIILGGGHETAIASYRGAQRYIDSYYPGSVLGIINFDAHFDLRDHTDFSSSGTPFSQAAEDCFLNQKVFSYACYGICKESNTRALFKKAKELGVQYLLDIDLNVGRQDQFNQSIQKFIANCDFIYLTIDLDVFSAEVSPGVSAPATLGIPLELVLHAIDVLKSSVRNDGQPKLLLADICELNPRFDIDNRTAKVAARLCYQLFTDFNY